MSTAIESIDERLRAIFANDTNINLVILFGSLANGSAGFDSDIDLAVGAIHPLTTPTKIQLIGSLAETTGRPVDLIDLSTVGEPLLGQIIQHGRRILGTDTAYVNLVSKHLANLLDFVPYQLIRCILRVKRFISSNILK